MRTSINLRQQATSKVEQQRRNQKRRRHVLHMSLFVLLASFLLWVGIKIINPNTFPIRSVKIVGNYNHVDHQQLRQTILPYLNSGFLWVDETSLSNQLAQLPWIETATVQRIWPYKLQINIVEKAPIAHWNNDNLISTQGDTFSPGNVNIPNNLPWLFGPQGQQNEVWTAYQTLSNILIPLNIKIISIALSQRQSWEIKLNNDMLLILGRDDAQSRLQRFVTVYNKIFGGNTNQVDYVDLRYSNGIAVKWKNNNNNSITPSTVTK